VRTVLSRLSRPGVIAGVLLLFGASSLGDAPDTRASTEEIAAYFVAHRSSVLVAVVLLGAATIGVLGFAASEWRRVNAEHGVAAAVAAGGALIAVALIETGMVLPYATLAYVVGAEAPTSAKALFEVTLVTAPIVSVPILVLIAGVAWAEFHRRRVSARFVVSVVAVVLLAASPFSFAARGPFSPDVQQQVVFNTMILWLVVSELTRRRTDDEGDVKPPSSRSSVRQCST
jgi:hypothetical protein